ncbi:MAG: hypothetical protein JWM47_3062 [Acidimicrobiales bacterium]|nr:hypothetical protein [Acidimicrobiales bacterium]
MSRIRHWHGARGVALALGLAIVVGALGACASDKAGTADQPGGNGGSASVADGELVGLFRLTPGAASGDKITGTWFRMLQPGGDAQHGPYMKNADSPAAGGEATLLAPGTSGGLRSAGYQSQPAPAFDGTGNSLADAITLPTRFFGVKFSISTNKVDPQTQTEVPPPTIRLKDGKLTADLTSWAASWNNQQFNQGAPKPVVSTGAKAPGQEQAERVWDWVAQRYLEAAPKSTSTGKGATGTFDLKARTFVLEWTSYIDGGPFNGFTGLWHLEGTFEPSGRAPDAAK